MKKVSGVGLPLSLKLIAIPLLICDVLPSTCISMGSALLCVRQRSSVCSTKILNGSQEGKANVLTPEECMVEGDTDAF